VALERQDATLVEGAAVLVGPNRSSRPRRAVLHARLVSSYCNWGALGQYLQGAFGRSISRSRRLINLPEAVPQPDQIGVPSLN